MKFNRSIFVRSFVLISLIASLTGLSTRLQADTGSCGGVTITLPFNDVMTSPFFCQIAAAYYSGLTNGTTATTYSPTQTVTREQMAAFTTRTLDQSLKRDSKRAALNQWWTTSTLHYDDGLATTQVGTTPTLVQSDGTDVWVANLHSSTVSRVRASDGKLLETWTGATNATAVLVAMGRIFITGDSQPGSLYMIDPSQPPGVVTAVSSSLGNNPQGIAFDGSRIWTANNNTVSIITPTTSLPWSVTTISFPGSCCGGGIIYDGNNMWITDGTPNALKKLDSTGAVLQTVAVGLFPRYPIFDGTNIWVPNATSNSITVIRASIGEVVATLTGNSMDFPMQAAFDGQRILVTNNFGQSVSLWKATDLTPLGSFSVGKDNLIPTGVCSDGVNFWITLRGQNKLGRF